MLADAIMDEAGGIGDAFGQVRAMAALIRGAQRFEFSDDALAAAAQVCQSRPSSLLAAIPLCRPPYETVWVERPGTMPGRSLHGELPVPAEYEIHAPRRVGYLVRSVGSDAIAIACAWSIDPSERYLNCEVNVSPLGFLLYTGKSYPENNMVESGESVRKKMHLVYGAGAAADREVVAWTEIAKRTHKGPMQFATNLLEHLRSIGKLESGTQAMVADIQGENEVLMAMLALLNSRNCVSIEKADLTKINRARVKSGRRAMLARSIVKISLSRRDRLAAGQDKMSELEIRRHMVRGHFKVKKRGVYWWRPFIRGRGEMLPRKGYVVSGTATQVGFSEAST